MKERLNLFLQSKHMTPTEFSDILGIQRSGLSHILSGRNNPGYDFIKKFAEKFPDVNLQWLITGKGEMYNKVTNAANDLFSFSNQKETLDINEKHLSENTIKEHSSSPSVKKRILMKTILIYSDNTFEEYTSTEEI